MSSAKKILEKYHDTIAQEINVKSISLLDEGQQVVVQYIPLGNMLWDKFWKDTWRIISASKQWNAKILDDGQLFVEDWSNSWTLSADQFDVRYSWFDWDNRIVEDGVMIELDLSLTEKLLHEWIAREISRFLNQMRKEADYEVSDRVACWFITENDTLSWIIAFHEDYLKSEALLSSLWRKVLDSADLHKSFEIEEGIVEFFLLRN